MSVISVKCIYLKRTASWENQKHLHCVTSHCFSLYQTEFVNSLISLNRRPQSKNITVLNQFLVSRSGSDVKNKHR